MAHIVIAGEWTTLDRVRNGALVETTDGILAIVSEYSGIDRNAAGAVVGVRRHCYLLASGETFCPDSPDTAVRVRPLELVLVGENDPFEQYTHLKHLTENIQGVVAAVWPVAEAVMGLDKALSDLTSWLPVAESEEDE